MPGLMPWAADPGPALETVFAAVAAGPMAGLPLLGAFAPGINTAPTIKSCVFTNSRNTYSFDTMV